MACRQPGILLFRGYSGELASLFLARLSADHGLVPLLDSWYRLTTIPTATTGLPLAPSLPGSSAVEPLSTVTAGKIYVFFVQQHLAPSDGRPQRSSGERWLGDTVTAVPVISSSHAGDFPLGSNAADEMEGDA